MLFVFTRTRRVSLISLILLLPALFSTKAQADMYDLSWGWGIVENNSNAPVTDQLSVDVAAYGTNQALFTFSNTGPASSSITGIYFDDGALLGMTGGFITSGSVIFSAIEVIENGGGQTHPDLPGATNVNPEFETSAGFFAASSSGSPDGIGPGESLGIVFDLKNDEFGVPLTFDDVIDSINAGFNLDNYTGTGAYDGWTVPTLRIGLHVQDLGEGGEFSDTYILTPVPGAFLLGMIGLGIAGVKMRKFA